MQVIANIFFLITTQVGYRSIEKINEEVLNSGLTLTGVNVIRSDCNGSFKNGTHLQEELWLASEDFIFFPDRRDNSLEWG